MKGGDTRTNTITGGVVTDTMEQAANNRNVRNVSNKTDAGIGINEETNNTTPIAANGGNLSPTNSVPGRGPLYHLGKVQMGSDHLKVAMERSYSYKWFRTQQLQDEQNRQRINGISANGQEGIDARPVPIRVEGVFSEMESPATVGIQGHIMSDVQTEMAQLNCNDELAHSDTGQNVHLDTCGNESIVGILVNENEAANGV